MRGRHYTILIADRSSGVVRRAGVSLRPAIAVAVGILSVPVLMGLGAKWSAGGEIDQLRTNNSSLTVENGSYRAATGELTAQIQSLESVINDLGTRATLAPEQVLAMQRLPAMVKTRAAGGTNVAAVSPAVRRVRLMIVDRCSVRPRKIVRPQRIVLGKEPRMNAGLNLQTTAQPTPAILCWQAHDLIPRNRAFDVAFVVNQVTRLRRPDRFKVAVRHDVIAVHRLRRDYPSIRYFRPGPD